MRPPRVHITYNVEIGDAIETRNLPFQLGVLGDFTGMPLQPLPRLRDRTFFEVNPDNFDEVLEGMKPHVAFSVENRLLPGAPQLNVDLHFKSLKDFEPENVAAQVKPLRELIELRTKLNDLLGKLQGNDKLEELLTEAITDPQKLKRLESEIHGSVAAAAAPPAGAEPAAEEASAPPAPEEPIDLAPEEPIDLAPEEPIDLPPGEPIDLAPAADAPLDAPTPDGATPEVPTPGAPATEE
jgi:type VI secretion system protein ImpB